MSPQTKVNIYTDSSRIASAFRCPQQRYWGSHENLVSPDVGESATVGLAFHRMVEFFVKGANAEDSLNAGLLMLDLIPLDLLTADSHPRRMEWDAILRGLFGVFVKTIYPRLQDEYRIIDAERELQQVIFENDKYRVIYMTRLDLIVQRLEDDTFFNINLKTTTWFSDLAKNKKYDLQLLMEADTLRQQEDVQDVGGSIILGANLGHKTADREGGYRHNSPFAYAWVKEDPMQPGSREYRTEYTKNKGWYRTPSWVNPGLDTWFAHLFDKHLETLSGQFMLSPAMNCDPLKAAAIKEQIARQEIRYYEDYHNNIPFSQNLSNCDNDGRYNRQCPYLGLCHGGAVREEFTQRVPNHPMEVI